MQQENMQYTFHMRILIFTSKDHPYATMLMNLLATSQIFAGCDVYVLEQSVLLPRHSTFSALWKYFRKAGVGYVFTQILKQKIFLLRQFFAWCKGDTHSVFYPYMKRKDVQFHRSPYTSIATKSAETWIREIQPDSILSLLSKEIIPKHLLALPTLGAFNLHPSLLPAYKGVSPTFWVLADGESVTGVTLHVLDEGIDTGPFIGQASFSIPSPTTEHAVYVQAVQAGATLVIDLLHRLKKGESFTLSDPLASSISSYRSLPTRAAVRAFHANGHRFFRLKEFH